VRYFVFELEFKLGGDKNMCDIKYELTLESDAVFIGWLHSRMGNPIALYNITAQNHPSFGSTVTSKTLRDMNLNVPPTPQVPEQREITRSVAHNAHR
jgi:hypothetical protein